MAKENKWKWSARDVLIFPFRDIFMKDERRRGCRI